MRFDYQEFRVSGRDHAHFVEVVRLAMLLGGDKLVHGFKTAILTDKDDQSWGGGLPHEALFLYTAPNKDATTLPSPVGPAVIAEIAWTWLEKAPYPPQPDHDGDNERGWRVRYDKSFDLRDAV